MQRKFKLLALLLMLALLLSGCTQLGSENTSDPAVEPTVKPTVEPLTVERFTDYDAVYAMYNEVKVGDTLDTLTARFGTPTVEKDPSGDIYLWRNEDGYGVYAIFFSNGVLRSKSVYFEDMRQFRDISGATGIANYALLDTSHDFTMACAGMGGKPCELGIFIQDSSADPDIYRLFVWVDEYDSNVQILFNENEKILRIAYALADRTAE
jgi:hypothetical protein